MERFVELPGLRMRITEAGRGEPVIMLHGFPQDSREAGRRRDRRTGRRLHEQPVSGGPGCAARRDHLAMSVPVPGAKLDRGFAFRALRYGWFNLVLPWPGLGPLALRRTGLAQHMLRAHSTSMSPDTAAAFAGQFKDPARAHAGSALYRKFIQPEGLRLLRGNYRSQVVTRVLVGTEDHVVKPNFEGAVAIQDAGHFLVDDRPHAVADQILDFLKR